MSHRKWACTRTSLSSEHEELNISLQYNFEGIRSHNYTKFLCPSPKKNYAREITLLTGSSSHEELSQPPTFWRKPCNACRGMTLNVKMNIIMNMTFITLSLT